MGYYEGNISDLTTGGGYNNGGFFGNDGFWGIILLAMIFGYGNNGFGWGGGGAAGGNLAGYEIGKLATTNDVASGFSTSAIMSNQRESQLAMANGFAGVQQSLCQGFNGINTAILNSANATERGFATTNYNLATSLAGISREIGDCCCATQRAIDGVNYNMAKNTCDIIQAGHNDTQRIIDFLTADKIETLNRKLTAAELQLSQVNQNAYLVSAIRPCPIPSYTVANPFCCNTTTTTTTTPTA